MHFTGIIIALATFLTIGIWHPIVIKTEYYWGTRPWVVYLVVGLACIGAALFIENTIVSAIVGVFGASALWGIGELFAQQRACGERLVSEKRAEERLISAPEVG